MTIKAQLRDSALKERQVLSQADYLSRNQSLSSQLLKFIEDNNFKSIHFFLPIVKNNEPDFRLMFTKLWDDGREIMVSKTHFKTKSLSHYWLEPSTVVKESAWGIPEPENAIETSFDKAELIVVPLLLADRAGHRIGYGGGYYDRLLMSFQGSSIGVSLLAPLDSIPIEPWDVPLQKVLFA
jgi:5-formyltetrahydrofolate cyclo-ligase